jgi:hypothetical protein
VAILNITYQGRSADLAQPLDERTADADVLRIAVEVVRSGDLPGLVIPDLAADAFRHFVVDRITDPNGVCRIYLRPKVVGAENPIHVL